MTYRVEILPAALKELAALPKRILRQIDRRIRRLAGDPRPPTSVALKGVPGLRRERSGDYPILYRVEEDQLLVLVVRIRHRRDVYRNLP